MQTYFGVKGVALDRFISRAYRDMNRTLRGTAALNPSILQGAKAKLKKRVRELTGTAVPPDEPEKKKSFDEWHHGSCQMLLTYYKRAIGSQSKTRLTYGQAQKWINMTLKYCWICGDVSLESLQPWLSVAHIPVDEVILVAAEEEGAVATRPCRIWSGWNNKDEYRDFQQLIRVAAKNADQSPLEMELAWWTKYRPRVTGATSDRTSPIELT